MQKKLSATDDINLYRKSFGNMNEALKYPKYAFYYMDSMVVKTKKKEEIDLLAENNQMSNEDYKLYLKTF